MRNLGKICLPWQLRWLDRAVAENGSDTGVHQSIDRAFGVIRRDGVCPAQGHDEVRVTPNGTPGRPHRQGARRRRRCHEDRRRPPALGDVADGEEPCGARRLPSPARRTSHRETRPNAAGAKSAIRRPIFSAISVMLSSRPMSGSPAPASTGSGRWPLPTALRRKHFAPNSSAATSSASSSRHPTRRPGLRAKRVRESERAATTAAPAQSLGEARKQPGSCRRRVAEKLHRILRLALGPIAPSVVLRKPESAEGILPRVVDISRHNLRTGSAMTANRRSIRPRKSWVNFITWHGASSTDFCSPLN